MLNLIILLTGFLPLIYGANLLVDSASSLAKKLDIPNIVIGLTIVAFGTSSPELVVNVFASVSGNSAITLGNIIGSNIFNIMGILGVSAIIYPLAVKSNTTWIEIPLCLLSSVAVFILINDTIIANSSVSKIDRVDGLILLLFFLIFLVYNFQLMKGGSFNEEIPVREYSISKSIVLMISGLILLFIGGEVIVTYAIKFSKYIGVPERVIALTIVSIGTSLPELATSTVAARKKNVDIAVGNIVGSNIFNSFLILGVSGVISPISLQKMSNLDLSANIAASLLLFLFMFTGKGRELEKWEGMIFISLYFFYLLLLIFA